MRMHMIVLVDDEPEVLSALRRSLSREPYLVLSTRRPQEALRWVEALDVSAVVSDERMPGMTGTELLDRIFDRSPETARILLTAFAHTAARRPHAIECMIEKPWDDSMLKRALREFLPEPVGD